MMASAPVAIPNAVLTRASEIPVDRATESGEPALARAANERIMPNTVPNSPNRVPSVEIVAMTGRFCSIEGSSRAVLSSISFWMIRIFCSLVCPDARSTSL